MPVATIYGGRAGHRPRRPPTRVAAILRVRRGRPPHAPGDAGRRRPKVPDRADWTWSDAEDAARAAGWKRVGREFHGPCPVTGAGKNCAWVALGRDGGIAAGCRACSPSGGGLSPDDYRDHLVALGLPEPARRSPAGYEPVRPRRRAQTPSSRPAGALSAPEPAASDLPARVWAAASDPAGSPGWRYLVRRGAWPAAEPLPESVRWVSAQAAADAGEGRPASMSGAVGALCYRYAAPGDGDATHAVAVEAVTADAVAAKLGDAGKRPAVGDSRLAGGERVFVVRAGGAGVAGVWQCEGPIDGLAIGGRHRVSGAAPGPDVAVIAALSVSGLTPAAVAGWPNGPVVIAAQCDDSGVRAAGALRAALREDGRTATVELPGRALDGADWADAVLVEAQERAASQDAPWPPDV